MTRETRKRIQHFLKVHSLARIIGLNEDLTDEELFTLETAAYVHDIGIHAAEKKYGSSAGKYQEEEGPAPARAMLEQLKFPEDIIARVCWALICPPPLL